MYIDQCFHLYHKKIGVAQAESSSESEQDWDYLIENKNDLLILLMTFIHITISILAVFFTFILHVFEEKNFFSIQWFLLLNLSLSLKFFRQCCLFKDFCSWIFRKKRYNNEKKQNYGQFFANKYICCSGLVKNSKTKNIIFQRLFSMKMK